jgi:hypothetical protein
VGKAAAAGGNDSPAGFAPGKSFMGAAKTTLRQFVGFSTSLLSESEQGLFWSGHPAVKSGLPSPVARRDPVCAGTLHKIAANRRDARQTPAAPWEDGRFPSFSRGSLR